MKAAGAWTWATDCPLAAVQYLKFTVGDRKPVAVGSDLPEFEVEATLLPDQQAALLEDLAG